MGGSPESEPQVQIFSSHAHRWEGFQQIWETQSRCCCQQAFKVLKAHSHSLSWSRALPSDPFTDSYRGLVMSPELGIQMKQYPVIPPNPPNCLLVFRGCIWIIVSFWSLIKLILPASRKNPRNLTACLQIWAFGIETLEPQLAKWLRM